MTIRVGGTRAGRALLAFGVLAVVARASEVRGQNYSLSAGLAGPRGSPAFTLFESLDKFQTWHNQLFGDASIEGSAFIKACVIRSMRSGLALIHLDDRYLAANEIAVFWDDEDISQRVEQLSVLASLLSQNWPVALEGMNITAGETGDHLGFQVARVPPSRALPRASLNLPHTGESELIGREEELSELHRAWKAGQPNVLCVVAPAGAGKTALIKEWLRTLGAAFGGAELVYGDSFYRQETPQLIDSADEIVAQALRWFGDPEPDRGGPRDKSLRLAAIIKRQRTLFVLDGIEPLQYPPGPKGGELRDAALRLLLLNLAMANPGLCVVTTRYGIPELLESRQTVAQIDLGPLTPEAGASLLLSNGVRRRLSELRETCREFGGDCLALTLLATYLRDRWDGDLTLRNQVSLPAADRRLRGHAHKVIEAYEQWFGDRPSMSAMLRLLGLFDRPADERAIKALLKRPAIPHLTSDLIRLDRAERDDVLTDLRKARLLYPRDPKRPAIFDCHPLVRGFYGELLRRRFPKAWVAGHARLYEHYQHAAPEYPATISEMGSLYAAVHHGCNAGKYRHAFNEVYRRRIQHGDQPGPAAFNAKVLGAIGAELTVLSHFLKDPWDAPVPNLVRSDQGRVLHDIGYDLRVLGRLEDAILPLRRSIAIARELAQKSKRPTPHYDAASMRAGNLSGLYLSVGRFDLALKYARMGLQFADRCRENIQRVVETARVADVLSQRGRTQASRKLFQEAENLQAQSDPTRPSLYAYCGFWFCDLLLDEGRYEDVKRRATYALKIAESDRVLFDIGLSHLSLGLGMLQSRRGGEVQSADTIEDHLRRSIEFLEKSAVLDYLPRALLGMSAYYFAIGKPKEAAEQCRATFDLTGETGMHRHEVDCLLMSARISLQLRRRAEARKYLQKVARLVHRIGYRRRLALLSELRANARASSR
ncbi:MAG: AAA family ATPase [Gemmataceae bacterium]